MYDTLLEMGFRGEINELIDSRQHTAIFTALDKTAGHVEDRMSERAPGSYKDILKIRRVLRKKKLKRGQTYYAPVTGGYAVIGDVGRRRRRHVVKTILSPEMKPPGLPLYGLTS